MSAGGAGHSVAAGHLAGAGCLDTAGHHGGSSNAKVKHHIILIFLKK